MNKEDALQIAVANYIRLQYPNLLFFHVPNGGKRNVIEASKFKRMGVLSGVPDILILNFNMFDNGLAIELKIKPNKPSKNQLEVIERFKNVGFRVEVCYDFESAKEVIDDFIKHLIK